MIAAQNCWFQKLPLTVLRLQEEFQATNKVFTCLILSFRMCQWYAKHQKTHWKWVKI